MIEKKETRPPAARPMDVVVVGGGPAGSTVAQILAQAGFQALLVEQSRYDQTRVGELISPEGLHVLKCVLPDTYQDFLISPLVINSAWESPDLEIVEHTKAEPWWSLKRLDLDRALAQAASDAGAEVQTGSKIRNLSRDPDSELWTFELDNDNGAPTFSARFLVDATGRACQIARSLGAERRKFDSQSGLVGFLSGPEQPALPAEMLLETTERGWWYAAPLEAGMAVAVFITDKDLDRGLPEVAWEQAWSESKHLKSRLQPYTLVERPKRVTSDSSILFPSFGPGWAATGDASFAHDPLSNLGLGRAIYEGARLAETLAGALDAHRPFRGALFAEESGYKFTEDTKALKAHYRQVLHWPNSMFWGRRTQGRLTGGVSGQVKMNVPETRHLHFVSDQLFECTQCGRCCRSAWSPELAPKEWKPIKETFQALQLAEAGLQIFAIGDDAKVRLDKNEEGACRCLQQDNLCALHLEGGPKAKPVDCQTFPFEFRETPDGVTVGVSFLCRSVQNNSGRPLTEYESELQSLLQHMQPKVISEKVPVTWGRAIEWADYLKLEKLLLSSELLGMEARLWRWRLSLWVCSEEQEAPSFETSLLESLQHQLQETDDHSDIERTQNNLQTLEELLAISLLGRLSEEPQDRQGELIDRFFDGGEFTLSRVRCSVSFSSLNQAPCLHEADWIPEEMSRYLRSLVERRSLLDQVPLLHNLCLLGALQFALVWETALQAMNRGAEKAEKEDWYRAVELAEYRWVCHQRDELALQNSVRVHLEDALEAC